MTGYWNTNQKIHCGKSFGLLEIDGQRVLGYEVPSSARPEEQRLAFAAALELGEATNRNVAIPTAYYEGRRVDFCMMFHLDEQTFTHEHRLAATLSGVSPDQRVPSARACAELPLGGTAEKGNLLCLAFSMLSQNHTDTSKTIRLCDPQNPKYRNNHASNCGTDEIGMSGTRLRRLAPSLTGHESI